MGDTVESTKQSDSPRTVARAAIRSEAASIQPVDNLEGLHRSEALAWIDSGAPRFRTAKPVTPVHLVSYFAVIDAEHILLVDYKNAQLWLPADAGFSILMCRCAATRT
jgi:8-oxo-dGTP diphosphatase